MRVFLAGATGVIGIRLAVLLAADGHDVGGMTRSPEKADHLRQLGCLPIVCDVFDRVALDHAIRAFAPDLVLHQLTDLPDRLSDLPGFWERNQRVRSEGTRNLVDAAQAAGGIRVLAQSVAWDMPTEAAQRVIVNHERMVLDVDGVVVRYGRFYGPGTFYSAQLPPPPRIEIDAAAARTMAAVDAPSGIVVISE